MMVGNRSASEKLLEQLARSKDEGMRWRVAADTNASVNILQKLSADKDE